MKFKKKKKQSKRKKDQVFVILITNWQKMRLAILVKSLKRMKSVKKNTRIAH